jgi:NAD(P)H-hydrate epimerase
MLLGPGLTREKEAVAFIDRLLGSPLGSKKQMGFGPAPTSNAQADRPALPPLVVDADGLNILSGMDHWWQHLPAPSVLTPHLGEMARLTGESVDALEADRIGSASKFAQQWGHVVVLKGAFSVVASPDGKAVVMPFANPALATAGSGDVLAGAIVSLRAQGLAAFDAAVCGAYLHGLAGEIARKEIGASGVVAGDLSARLPIATRRIMGG